MHGSDIMTDPLRRLGTLAVVVLIVGFSAISGYATFTGLRSFIVRAGVLPEASGTVVAVALAGLVMLAVVVSLRHLRQRRLRSRRFAWLAIALIGLTISVSFGFGLYWNLFRRADFTDEMIAQARQSLYADVLDLRNSLEHGEQFLASLAAESDRKAAREKNIGGTCGYPGDGTGPRYRLRLRDRQRFAELADLLAARKRRMAETLAALPATGDLQAMAPRQALMRLRRTANRVQSEISASRISVIRQELARRQHKGRGKIVDPKYGTTFTCYDAGLEERLTFAIQALDLPPAPRVTQEVPGRQAQVYFAIMRLWNGVLALGPDPARAAEAGAGSKAAGNALGRQDLLPLLTAVSIDLLIVLLSLAAPMGRARGFGTLLEDEHDSSQSMADLWAALERNDAAVAWKLRPFLLQEGSHLLAAVPIAGDDAAYSALIALRGLREARQVSQLHRPAWWVRRQLRKVGSPYDGASCYAVYRLPAATHVRLAVPFDIPDTPAQTEASSDNVRPWTPPRREPHLTPLTPGGAS